MTLTTTDTDNLIEAVCWALLLAGDKTHTRADVRSFLRDAGGLVDADPDPGYWSRAYLDSRGAGSHD